MRTFGNIIWHFPFFGFIGASITWLVGLVLTALVVTAPIGLGLMELGKFLFAPFTRTMVIDPGWENHTSAAWKNYSRVIAVCYLPIGIVLAVMTIFSVVAAFVTLVGIPVGIVMAKSLGTYLWPVGKKCVGWRTAENMEQMKAAQEMVGSNGFIGFINGDKVGNVISGREVAATKLPVGKQTLAVVGGVIVVVMIALAMRAPGKKPVEMTTVEKPTAAVVAVEKKTSGGESTGEIPLVKKPVVEQAMVMKPAEGVASGEATVEKAPIATVTVEKKTAVAVAVEKPAVEKVAREKRAADKQTMEERRRLKEANNQLDDLLRK